MHLVALAIAILVSSPAPQASRTRQPISVESTHGIWTHCDAPRSLSSDYTATVRVCK